MQIEITDHPNLNAQSVAAGFSSLEDYVITLLARDAERVAIQQGIDDMKAGRVQPFEEFDAELRKEFGFAPQQ